MDLQGCTNPVVYYIGATNSPFIDDGTTFDSFSLFFTDSALNIASTDKAYECKAHIERFGKLIGEVCQSFPVNALQTSSDTRRSLKKKSRLWSNKIK